MTGVQTCALPIYLNYNEEIEVKSAEFQDPSSAMKAFYLNKNGIHDNTLRGFVDVYPILLKLA